MHSPSSRCLHRSILSPPSEPSIITFGTTMPRTFSLCAFMLVVLVSAHLSAVSADLSLQPEGTQMNAFQVWDPSTNLMIGLHVVDRWQQLTIAHIISIVNNHLAACRCVATVAAVFPMRGAIAVKIISFYPPCWSLSAEQP